MTHGVVKLLEAIRLHEAGKAGYNADFRNNNKWDLQKYTLDEVIALSRSQVTKGEPSSAIGGYQFLTKTLISLKTSLGLKGGERFTTDFQDDLAFALMIRRGLWAYIHDKLTAERFCNKLAMEWASLPVVTDMQGSRRYIRRGQSYYAGDGLNKAFHKPERIMALVKAIKPELVEAEKLNARTTS
jgi:muramidase (phage lysozyme)